MENLQAYTIKESEWRTLIVLPKNKHSLMIFLQYLSGRGKIVMDIQEDEIKGLRKFIIFVQFLDSDIEKMIEYINKNMPIE